MTKSNISDKKKTGVVIKDPPATLVLNKKYVQQFPNGQKVVIYNCPALNKNLTLTFDNTGLQLTESTFSILDKLRTINEIETIYFKDGSELNINEECSNNILELYNILEEGKEYFEEYIEESSSNFLKILEHSTKLNK